MKELHGIAKLTVNPGKLEEFKRLAAECMEKVRTKDTGTLQYDLYFSSDFSECVAHESYRDSEALLEHLSNLGETMAALFETCSGTGMLLGTPSAELKEMLKSSEVRLYLPYQSM